MLVKKLVTGIVCLHLIVNVAFAKKSVFIISNHMESRAQAYSIEGTQVNFQDNVNISTLNPGYGPVGIEVWPEKELMFVTYEASGVIVWAEQIWQTAPELSEIIDPNDYQQFVDSLKEQLND